MQPNPLAFTVLVLNAGSASLKAALIGASGERLWHGQRSWNPSSGASQADGLRPWLEEVLGPWADKVQLVLAAAYVGHMDDLAAFDRALTANEVAQLFALKNGVRDLR